MTPSKPQIIRSRRVPARATVGIAAFLSVLAASQVAAQQPSGIPGISIRGTITEQPRSGDDRQPPSTQPPPPPPLTPSLTLPPFSNTITVAPPPASPQAVAPPAASVEKGRLQLSLQLTRDGNRIASGILWRIYSINRGRRPTLVATERTAEPTVSLVAGSYVVIASLGRAFVSQKVDVRPGATAAVELVLNAGGLRVAAGIAGGGAVARDALSFDIYTEERDQTGERVKIVSGFKPGRVVRLNAGIYQLVSQLGDANATVRSEVTVEAGKLSEVQVTHQAARISFKLVDRAGGEAIADTQWVILAGSGGIVKETAGALPTHMLAPGTYTVSATSAGRMFQREFAVNSGDNLVVEVIAN